MLDRSHPQHAEVRHWMPAGFEYGVVTGPRAVRLPQGIPPNHERTDSRVAMWVDITSDAPWGSSAYTLTAAPFLSGCTACDPGQMQQPLRMPLPRQWPEHVALAVVHAVALARVALAHVYGGFSGSPLTVARLRARVDRLEGDNRQLREQLRIKDARMTRLQPHRRPHYLPEERLAILTLRAASGWSTTQTACAFLVTAQTIAEWMQVLHVGGPQALLATRQAVNRFPDFVAEIVRALTVTFPTMGRRRIAQLVARAGVHLSATTVRRIRAATPRMPQPGPAKGAPGAESSDRRRPAKPEAKTVIARYTHHVWSVDFTLVPIFHGFWVPWLPFAIMPCWPFCWHVAVVVDHFSRSVVYARAFFREPTAAQTCRLLSDAVAAAQEAPRHVVTDQGGQFQTEYLDWCDDHDVRPRFGAIGKKGSIAVVERFIRTLKAEGLRRITVPLRVRDLNRELAYFARWYNAHRPHGALGGATPAEVRDGQTPAHVALGYETRSQHPVQGRLAARRGIQRIERVGKLELVIGYAEDRTHLPVVELRRAA